MTMVTKSKPVGEPDLFSVAKHDSISPIIQPAAKINKPSKPAASSPLLPRNLSNSLERLSNEEFQRLLAAVLDEQRRRNKDSIALSQNPGKEGVEANTPALTVGKLNAVRAAFKAGLKPSQIARQFGISQSDVRKALARDGSSAKT
jgi:hypothetical protein